MTVARINQSSSRFILDGRSQFIQKLAKFWRWTLILRRGSSDERSVKLLFLIKLVQSQSGAPQPVAEPIRPESPVIFAINHVEETAPHVIRIFNLPEGMREVVLPPAQFGDLAKAERTVEPIRIFNLSEGTREIAP